MAVLDLSGDQALIDNLETVTLTSEGGPYVITTAWRSRDDTTNQQSAGGDYLHRDMAFHLPIHLIYIPKVGDIIKDGDGVFYNVLSVRRPKFNDAWICQVREALISASHAGHDRVTLWPAVEETDAYGSTITTHPAADAGFGNVWAAITLRPSVVVDEMAQREFVEVYDVHVAEEIGTLHEGDRLLDQDGHWYTIVSYRNREQIDELSVIVCEDRLR